MFGVSADGDGVGLHYKTQSSLDEMLEYHPQEQQQQTTASRREREIELGFPIRDLFIIVT